MAYQPQPIELLDLGPANNANSKRQSPRIKVKLGGEVKEIGYRMDQWEVLLAVLSEYGVDRNNPILGTLWDVWESCYTHNQNLVSKSKSTIQTSMLQNLGRRNADLEKRLAEAERKLAAAQEPSKGKSK
jgi:hypothetical protein